MPCKCCTIGNKVYYLLDDFEKAEVLNNHFASVFTKEDTTNIPTIQTVNDNIEILDSINITSDKIIKQLNQLNIGKSPGPDGINAKVLKETASLTGIALKLIYTSSLEEGILPHQWKRK